MKRLALLMALASVILLGSVATSVHSQGTSQAQVSVLNQYRLNGFGFAILNETITFNNNGTSAAQIPTIQLGMPDSIMSKSTGFVNDTGGQLTVTSRRANGSTVFSIASKQELQPGAVIRLSLKTYLKDVISVNATAGATELFALTAPSLNIQATSLRSLIQLPPNTSLRPVPAGFSTGTNGSIPFYQRTLSNFKSGVALAQKYGLQLTDLKSLLPIDVPTVARVVTVSQNGVPQISDTITIQNVGDIQMSSFKLSLFSGRVTQVTIISSMNPPLLNPTSVTLPGGVLDLSKAPFKGQVSPGDNFTFTMLYNIPQQFEKATATRTAVTIPYSPPLDAVVGHYTIRLSLPGGFVPITAQDATLKNVNPLVQGSVQYEYGLSLGWAAEQAMPIASFLFAIAFLALFVRKGQAVQATEETESVGQNVSDMIRAFEEKTSLLNKTINDIKSQSSMGKKDFDEIRGRLDAARTRALQRLNDARAGNVSKRFYELTNQIGEAEREENRAAKDLINLYDQYYTKRMRKETFEKLLPSYKRRLDDSTNRLSDYLNTAQKEGKQV